MHKNFLASANDVAAGSNELGTVPAGAWASVLREGTASATVRASAERVASSALCATVHRLKNQIARQISDHCGRPNLVLYTNPSPSLVKGKRRLHVLGT